LRFAIELGLSLVGLAETDHANAIGFGDITKQVQSLVQIPNGNAPRFAFANLCVEERSGKIEFRGPLERKPTLPDVALILGEIVRDSNLFIVYTI